MLKSPDKSFFSMEEIYFSKTILTAASSWAATVREKNKDSTKKILVKFTLDKESITRQDIISIRTNINQMYDDATSIIYILKNKPNTFVYKEVNTINMNDEIFLYTEVIFNRTKHRLVPKHVLLTEAEKKDLLLTYDCKDTQLPRMVTTDFVCRYFGAKPGDMFKIDRPSPSSGIYITYRVVK